MTEITRLGKSARSSSLVIAGGRFETSGIVSEPGVPRDIASQTRSVLLQLEQLLQSASANKHNLTTMQIWLADMKDFEEMNRVYDLWVDDTDQPARACVGSQLATEDYLIEIRATGVL